MLDKSEQRLVDDIARVGWHMIGVSEEGDQPAFCYSIGMMVTFSHPEIIVFGLDVRMMARIINNMGDDLRKGRSFAEPVRYTGLVEGYACKTVTVAKRFHRDYFGYALWYRHHIGKHGTLEAIQCLWPDKKGLFPDEAGCHPAIKRRQPVLK